MEWFAGIFIYLFAGWLTILVFESRSKDGLTPEKAIGFVNFWLFIWPILILFWTFIIYASYQEYLKAEKQKQTVKKNELIAKYFEAQQNGKD